MEQFKLKSIEEFDLDFVNKLNEQSKANIPDSVPVLIPEISKEETIEDNSEFTDSFFSKPDQNENIEPIFTPQPADEAPKAPRPLVPIGQGNATYSPTAAQDQKILSEDDFADDTYSKPKKHSSSKVALAGKIISIVMLAATIVVFVLGCFVTVFLDNKGSDLGGICFNTMSADVVDSSGQTIVSKGDLIISKKVETSEYAPSEMIAVPSAIEQDRCDIHIINRIGGASADNVEIITTDITSSTSYSATVMSADSYGIVSSYIPVLGGLLHFAMDNAILVCVLFVLLAALWCLILVLIENKKPKTNKE